MTPPRKPRRFRVPRINKRRELEAQVERASDVDAQGVRLSPQQVADVAAALSRTAAGEDSVAIPDSSWPADQAPKGQDNLWYLQHATITLAHDVPAEPNR